MSYYKMKPTAIETDLYIKISVLARTIIENGSIDDLTRERLTGIFVNINPAYEAALEWFGNSEFHNFINAFAGDGSTIVVGDSATVEELEIAAVLVGKLFAIVTGQAVEEVEVDDSGILVDDDGQIIDESLDDSLAEAYALLLLHMAHDLANGGERIRMVTYWDAEEIDSEFSQLVRGFFGEAHPINDITISQALSLAVAHPSEHIYAFFDEPIQKLAYAISLMTDDRGLRVYQGKGYTIALDPDTAILVTDHPSGDLYEAINFIEVRDGEE